MKDEYQREGLEEDEDLVDEEPDGSWDGETPPRRDQFEDEEGYKDAKRAHEEMNAPDEWDGHSRPFERQFEDYSGYIEAVTDWRAGENIKQHFMAGGGPGGIPKDTPLDDARFVERAQVQLQLDHYTEQQEKAKARGDEQAAKQAADMVESYKKDLSNIPPAAGHETMKKEVLKFVEKTLDSLFEDKGDIDWKDPAIVADAPVLMDRFNVNTPDLTLILPKTDDVYNAEGLPAKPGNVARFEFNNQDQKNSFLNKYYFSGARERPNPYTLLRSMGMDISPLLVESKEEPKKEVNLKSYKP